MGVLEGVVNSMRDMRMAVGGGRSVFISWYWVRVITIASFVVIA